MRKMIVRFGEDKSGATAIEYGLLLALISAALVAVFPILQTALQTAFTFVATSMAIPV